MYLRAKFEPYSFSHSRDIHYSNLKLSRVNWVTSPLMYCSFCMFSNLLLIVDVHIKFEVSSVSLSGYIRDTNILEFGTVYHLEIDQK